MKRALIIVDVQYVFLKRSDKVVKSIVSLLKKVKYDLYVEAVLYAEKGSIWDIQTGWLWPKNKKTHTDNRILSLLPKNAIHIEKTTKSAFKGNKNLKEILKKNNIDEVHIVGLDTNDCVLATAYESFDLGFKTYVIKECCDSSSSKSMHDYGIEVLDHVKIVKSIKNIK